MMRMSVGSFQIGQHIWGRNKVINVPTIYRAKQILSPPFAKQLGYSNKDILVIVNIDDVGMHKDETEASFSAMNFGLVKSGSIMVPCPNFGRVVKLWKENIDLDLGIHLTLTCEWG